jgi:1,4-dihydroxy-2-naphthoate octaprenyltransferase
MNSPTSSLVSASLFKRFAYFIQLGRPLHLAGGFVFNGLGISIAYYLGTSLDWTTIMLCQLAITATQLMTHYSNDYFDQDADAAALTPTRWASGSRILPDGLLTPRIALLAALIFGMIALLATAVLTTLVTSPILTLTLLLLALFLAWNYSSPPLRLNRRGLGEITGALLVPGLTTLLGFETQMGHLTVLPFLAVVPLGCFQFAMLLSVNFPDAAGDILVNKRTLVVIWGAGRCAYLFVATMALAYLLLPLLIWWGLPWQVGFAVLLTLPIALWQVWRMRQGAATNPALWDGLAFWSMGLMIGTALLETAVFLVLS